MATAVTDDKTKPFTRHEIEEKLENTIGNDVRAGECYNKFANLDRGNTDILLNYALEYKHEAGIADSTLTTAVLSLLRFAQKANKPFADMTRDDVLEYLDHIRTGKKWQRTYVLFSINVTRFFKWFHYSDISYKERPKPAVVVNLGRVKFDKKTYKPTDMWTLEENELFFKYCPSPKIKCYHGLAIDTGARPHEILKLKIEDIVWPPDGGPPSFVVNGKTGSRTLRSLRYHRYIREWIEQHPKRSIPSSILICSKKTGKMLNEKSLRGHYTRYLKPYFTNLLDMAIGQDDRGQIQQLLKKPWNPYIFRHTVATEFLGQGRLTRDLGNQWFGWTEKSNMASTYENFDGHEAAQVLAESFGIVQETKKQSLPRLRECPNVTCKELNTPDAPFCVKCRVPLTLTGYMEKEKESLEMKEQMNKIQQELKSKTQEIQSLSELCEHSLELSSKQNSTISDYKGMVDDVMSKYDKLMGEYNNLKGLLDKSMSTTKTALGGIDELQSVMKGGLLIKPDRRTAEEIQRRVKILLQVAPDWKERTAPINARLTPEEERKVMELINQQKS